MKYCFDIKLAKFLTFGYSMKKINLNESVFDYLDKAGKKYKVKEGVYYFSKRYNKTVDIKKGMLSDGATYFPDIDSWFWIIHDRLKHKHSFKDGSHCSNHQASVIAFDVLVEERRYFISLLVFIGVWSYGYIKRLLKIFR